MNPKSNASRSTGVSDVRVPVTVPEPLPAAKRDARTTSELSSKQVMAVIVAHQNGVPAAEIAISLSLAAKDVEAVVRQLEAPDTREAAKQVILSKALALAERLMETTHAPTMLELMRDLAITEKKSPAGESKGGANVYIGVKAEDVQVNLVETPNALPEGSTGSVTDDSARVAVMGESKGSEKQQGVRLK